MLPLCFGTFFVFGAYLVIVGANQHALAAALDLDLTRTGLLGALISLGIAIGVLGSGPLLDRRPRRPLVLAGALAAALALGTVHAGMGFAQLAVHVLVAGVGLGALDNLCNVVIVERDREAAGSTLSLLHAAATLGALVTPLAIAGLAPDDFVASFRAVALGCAAVAGAALWVGLPRPPGHGEGSDEPVVGLRHPVFLAMCVVGFAYVGIEAGITVFAVPYATDALELASRRGQTAISAYWCGLFVGRIAVGALLHRPGAGLLALSGALTTAVLTASVALRWGALEAWMAVVGLTLSGVYPIMVAVAGRVVVRGTGRALGGMTAVASAGGFAVPWLTGWLGDRAGAAATLQSLALWSLAIAAAAGLAALRLRGSGGRTG